jgi:hypothetical protein
MKQIIKKILYKDSLLLGIVIGIVLPFVLFGVLYAISTLLSPEGKDYLIKLPKIILLSLIPNLLTLRYYLKKLEFDRTGRGILLVTFVLAIGYFAIFI